MTMPDNPRFEEELTCCQLTELTPYYEKFWPEHSNVSKICILMRFFWPKNIISELKKYRNVMFDATEVSWKIWRKTDRLKNSDFILESKMVELNRNKNLKQLNRPDAVRKVYFTLEINEQHN